MKDIFVFNWRDHIKYKAFYSFLIDRTQVNDFFKANMEYCTKVKDILYEFGTKFIEKLMNFNNCDDSFLKKSFNTSQESMDEKDIY